MLCMCVKFLDTLNLQYLHTYYIEGYANYNNVYLSIPIYNYSSTLQINFTYCYESLPLEPYKNLLFQNPKEVNRTNREITNITFPQFNRRTTWNKTLLKLIARSAQISGELYWNSLIVQTVRWNFPVIDLEVSLWRHLAGFNRVSSLQCWVLSRYLLASYNIVKCGNFSVLTQVFSWTTSTFYLP